MSVLSRLAVVGLTIEAARRARCRSSRRCLRPGPRRARAARSARPRHRRGWGT